jgi:small subunit ribosomal protein S18
LAETTARDVEDAGGPAAPGAAGPPESAPSGAGPAPRGERFPRREGGRAGVRDFRARRKVCVFCVDKTKDIDYKDVGRLRRFISDRGKIDPRRRTGTCAKHQRRLSVALKRARFLALLPYTGAQIQATERPGAA